MIIENAINSAQAPVIMLLPYAFSRIIAMPPADGYLLVTLI